MILILARKLTRTRFAHASTIAALTLVLAVGLSALGFAVPAVAQERKPNILVIMGDDVGWYNIGAYHQGIMSGKRRTSTKLATEGARFTDYYAEASCTAGRANFITGNSRSARA